MDNRKEFDELAELVAQASNAYEAARDSGVPSDPAMELLSKFMDKAGDLYRALDDEDYHTFDPRGRDEARAAAKGWI